MRPAARLSEGFPRTIPRVTPPARRSADRAGSWAGAGGRGGPRGRGPGASPPRGGGAAAERRAAEHGLRGLARRIRAISDVEAAYRGALGEGAGVLLLAGTGSIALGRDVRGGWGRGGGGRAPPGGA